MLEIAPVDAKDDSSDELAARLCANACIGTINSDVTCAISSNSTTSRERSERLLFILCSAMVGMQTGTGFRQSVLMQQCSVNRG